MNQKQAERNLENTLDNLLVDVCELQFVSENLISMALPLGCLLGTADAHISFQKHGENGATTFQIIIEGTIRPK